MSVVSECVMARTEDSDGNFMSLWGTLTFDYDKVAAVRDLVSQGVTGLTFSSPKLLDQSPTIAWSTYL